MPEGWTEYLGACPDTCYVNCTYNKNGGAAEYTDPSHPNGSNYGTAVIGNASLEFVGRAMAANYPFFAYIASHAPHGPATPAPWYAGLHSAVIIPHPPLRVVGVSIVMERGCQVRGPVLGGVSHRTSDAVVRRALARQALARRNPARPDHRVHRQQGANSCNPCGESLL